MIGETFGHYRVTSQLGAGGMGEVYRATDTRLEREVAVKVLPDAVAADPERLARFEREARVLAALDHPAIATIHGLEQAGGRQLLVMQLAEGRTLAERIEQGPLAAEPALRIALQIAEALEAAHEKGIVHRDLKPANVMVAADGRVKVLDFGLAKAFGPEAVSGDATERMHSPTLTARMTQAGMLMGTAAYMSPEQAAALPSDKRADIWSFGVVLYEMLTGSRLFQGETLSHTLADVLRAELDFRRLPARTPPVVRRLLERCLDRDPKRRLRDVGEARVTIADWLAGPMDSADTGAAVATPTAPVQRSWLPWIIAAGGLIAAAASVTLQLAPREPAEPRIRRLALKAPHRGFLREGEGMQIAISPDGRHVASLGHGGSDRTLVLQALDQAEARPLAGISGAMGPTFSPDGKWLAYGDNAGLFKVNLAGAQVLLAPTTTWSAELCWSDDGHVYYSDRGSVFRVPANGGAATLLLEGDPKARSFGRPSAIGGRNALVLEVVSAPNQPARIATLDLRSLELKELGLQGTHPRQVPTGHLIYGQGDRAFAVPFDASSLELRGDPAPLPEDIAVMQGTVNLAFSNEGTAIYLPAGAQGEQRFLRVDRHGREASLLEKESTSLRAVADPRLAPDGRRLAFTSGDNVWILDLAAATTTQFGSNAFYPLWSPDGRAITFTTTAFGTYTLLQRDADLSRPAETLLEAPHNLRTAAWSPDGSLVFREQLPQKGMDLSILWPAENGRKQVLLDGAGAELAPSISPDGKWLAYMSDETGREEVYVTSYPRPGGRVQISTRGGGEPAWSPNGVEVFYREGRQLVAVDVETRPEFRIRSRTVLFEGDYHSYRWHRQYEVLPDGSGFIMIGQSGLDPDIAIVLDWFTELKRLAPAER